MISMEKIKRLPPSSLGIALGGLSLILGMTAFLILPKYQNIQNLKNQAIQKTHVLEEQKLLFPLLSQASALAKKEFSPLLPMPQRHPMDREKIKELSHIFTAISQKNDLDISENSIDLSSITDQGEFITMEVQCSGDLFNFRNCLIDMIKLPFFKKAEEISIESDTKGIKKFTTKLLINITKS